MCETWTGVKVCFSCRVGFERRTRFSTITTCPQCGGNLVNVGGVSSNFKIPKKRDKKQWIKVERLYNAGVRFGPAGCCARSDPNPNRRSLPKRLSEVDDFLAHDELVQSRKSEGERLLEKINRASGKSPK